MATRRKEKNGTIEPTFHRPGHVISIATHISQLKSILSFYSSAFQGNTSLNLDGGLDISTDVSGSNITQKKPTESEEQELKESVRENEFFKTRIDYPREKEDESLVAYTLTITVGSNAHTTSWTDVSKEVHHK